MVSEKVLYWVGVSVLALFIGNHIALSHQGRALCLARHSLSAIDRLSGRANEVQALVLDGSDSRFDHAQMAVDQVQTRLASAQCALARHQAVLARVEAEHERLAAMQELRRTIVCPRPGLRIVIPQRPSMPHDGTI